MDIALNVFNINFITLHAIKGYYKITSLLNNRLIENGGPGRIQNQPFSKAKKNEVFLSPDDRVVLGLTKITGEGARPSAMDQGGFEPPTFSV